MLIDLLHNIFLYLILLNIKILNSEQSDGDVVIHNNTSIPIYNVFREGNDRPTSYESIPKIMKKYLLREGLVKISCMYG